MKLLRAQEHLGQLQADHSRFVYELNGYRMVREEDREPGYYLWRANIERPPPLDTWAALAGDCVHALRSALDHTAFALVQLKRPGETHSYFPISPKARKTRRNPDGFDKKHPDKLPCVDRKALAQVNWLQPHRGGGKLDRLWVVHSLDIIDKHRRLNLVEPALLDLGWKLSDCRVEGEQKWLGPLKDGAPVARFKLVPTGPNMQVQTQFAFDITFGETEPPLAGEPVMRTLQSLSDYVGGVVARFDRFFPR